MATRDEPTLADHVTSALSPALIMALIGSLVFFLVDVIYVGQFYSRLLWILFFFVFGSVLVARIAMQGESASRAGMYSSVLGLLAWLALLIYVQFPEGSLAAQFGWAINLGLIFLIWWCAQKLTWDSTFLDEETTGKGEGLLDAAGVDPEREKQDQLDAEEKKKKKRKKAKEAGGFAEWWQRYQDYREELQSRPRTHGVWVVYFSLAALPLFGLGQSLIPADDSDRRQYAFWLMCIYVGSALGLLLTTTFLGLRRYLRQKKMDMPISVTTTWLSMGTMLVVALLVVGTLMPRPYPEISIVNKMLELTSKDQKASQFAVKGGDSGKDEGRTGEQKFDKNGEPINKDGKNPSGGKDGKKGSSEQGKGKSQGDQKGKNQGQSNQQNQNSKNESGKDQQAKQQQGKENADKDQQGEKNSQSDTGKSPTPPKFESPLQSEWFKSLAKILKWIVLGIIAVVIVIFLLRSLLTFLANFTGWAKSLMNWLNAFWHSLFHWGGNKVGDAEQAMASNKQKRVYRAFDTFADPFLTGNADIMSPVELVQYSFAAWQAWARESGLPRGEEETPIEFAQRIGEKVPALAEDGKKLASHYAAAAYAVSLVDDDCRDDLRQFWLTLNDQPTSQPRTKPRKKKRQKV